MTENRLSWRENEALTGDNSTKMQEFHHKDERYSPQAH